MSPRDITPAAAERISVGHEPEDVRVAEGYPTEFSAGVAAQVGSGSPLGPFFLHRLEDDAGVGEVRGRFIDAGVAEIGYAVVQSCWGRGYATAAVCSLLELAAAVPSLG